MKTIVALAIALMVTQTISYGAIVVLALSQGVARANTLFLIAGSGACYVVSGFCAYTASSPRPSRVVEALLGLPLLATFGFSLYVVGYCGMWSLLKQFSGFSFFELLRGIGFTWAGYQTTVAYGRLENLKLAAQKLRAGDQADES